MRRKSRWTAGLAGVIALALTAGSALAGDQIAVIHLSGPLAEKPQGEMAFSFGNQPTALKDLVARFDKVREDESVKAVLITLGTPSMGLAQVEELREAMKSCAKPVYMHVDSLSTGTYLLATAAKHISVTPTGDVWLLGFYSESPYVKGMLDKIHVEADFIHIGDFKSAGEMLYREAPSKPAEENMNWLFDGLYGVLVKHVAEARYNGDQDKVRDLIDAGPYTAEQAVKAGLIDSVHHRQDLVAELQTRYGEDLKFVHGYGRESGPDLDFGNPFALFQLINDMMSGEKKSTKTSIAVVYVEGAIMPGAEQPNPFGGSSGAFSTTIRKGLDKAAADDSIKALVLRVDSPGGSALASEIIYDAVERVKAKGKPVVVSMGNVAASGGYYVSCGADHIFADPGTITASIGVVGGKLVTTGMWDWMGVKWHQYQRGDMAGMMSSSRKWNDTERNRIQTWMEDVYGVFKGHIVHHRKDKLTKDIDKMAGGRVYTGTQAVKLGLVDDLGTMKDAISKAADLAMLGDYELRILPRPKSIFDMFREGMGSEESNWVSLPANAPGSGFGAAAAFGTHSPLMEMALPLVQSLDPERAKVFMQALTRLELIRQEHVILMMPEDWTLRFH